MFDGKGQKALETAEKALSRIDSHEQLCAERWKEIRDQLGGIREILKRAIIGLITALGAVAWFYFSHGHP